ncbi:hypothetical protein BS78_08G126200 [Paspalum vaginatum]|nr:hypothetical protein BS78_08G126200 [Paspalum vaginatum]
MDLNEPPSDFDYDFLEGLNPLFCTQVTPTHHDVPSVSDVRQSLKDTRLEEDDQPEHVVDEVWSTPPIPYTGLSFATTEEASEYYNSYSKKVGFSVRTNTSRLGALTRKLHKLEFGGVEKKKKLDGGKKRKREKMKYTDCKARMVVKLIEGRWQVIYFVPEHNHDLVVKPSLKKFLRSHKGIPTEEKQFIVMLHGCNLPTGRILQLMNEFYGSAQQVPYEGKDISNFCSTIRKTEKYKDMSATLEYFKELQQVDPDFYYKIKLDSESRVESIFWIDGVARNAYIESYYDCISFDATYMTNMYDMPFTPFIGINKHGHSFQVGCAFLRDEKTTSYKWLFDTFLEEMKGKASLNIITYQDAAMRSAIAQVFSNANHRNCRWHIMDKFSGTIGPVLAEDNEPEEDFKECINHTRSEGFNAVLKKYVNPNMSMLHFVRQYQKIQEKCLVAEGGQDFRTDENERRRWSRYPIEKHASTVYTKNMFYRFSKEFEKTAEYDVKPDGKLHYLLVPNNKFVYGYGKRSYMVTAIEEDACFCCECSKFDRDGILCCHIMRILTRLGVKTIPEHYILKRWTPAAVGQGENGDPENSMQPNNAVHGPADFVARGMPLKGKKTLWFTNLSTSFADLAVQGAVSHENYEIMDKHIKHFGKSNTVAPSTSAGCGGASSSVPVPAPSPMTINNPPMSKTKGRKKKKRFTKGMNAGAKRKNKCSKCKS